jgi:vacuolar-type H+-ATPase subunit E/Vma4
MKPLGSIAAVIAAVREDAAAEAEALSARASAEIARIRGLDAADVVVLPDREIRLAAARQRTQARLSHEDWEDTREAVADREEWLVRAIALGSERLAAPEDPQTRRERLAALAREGLARLPGKTCEIVVDETDATLLGPEWCLEVAAAAGREGLRVVAGPVGGGCILRTADGRASFDNTYEARARRLQAVWRAALARLYEDAVSMASPLDPAR